MNTVMICAGDVSGETHAADFVHALHESLPNVRCFGLGGAKMSRAGVELVVDQHELAIGGIFELIRDSKRVWRAWRTMTRALSDRPNLLVLVDSPDFNLPLARRARKLGVPILYYISPQVWAWRRYRMSKIARRVDRMCVIFPFERNLYSKTGLRVDYVGHPLVDQLAPLQAPNARCEARVRLGWSRERPLIALFPGSRRNEIKMGLPLQLEAARLLYQNRPDIGFGIGLAPSISRSQVETIVRADVRNEKLGISIFEGAGYDLALAADLALTKPGTITLELTMLGTPMVVAFKGNCATYVLARMFSYVDSPTLPNIIAQKMIVPEYIQTEARPGLIATCLEKLLEVPEAEKQRQELAGVAQALGGGGAAQRVAAVAKEMVNGTVRP